MGRHKTTQYSPDYLVKPGDILADYLANLPMTQAELADRAGLAKKTINEIVRGKAQITPETARKLEKIIGRPAHFWSNLERQYQDDRARLAEQKRMESAQGWAKRFPAKRMTDLGWLPREKDGVKGVESLLRFFGIASSDQWETVYRGYQVSFRQSKTCAFSAESLSAWLRRGEILARETSCDSFDRSRFLESLEEIRGLTTKLPENFVPLLKKLCSSAGVIVLFVPELPRCAVFGATRWISGRPVIQLSLRYKSNDHLWFTFFHEAGHILKHGRRDVFIEYKEIDGGKEEEEADAFARDKLIPPAAMKAFMQNKKFSRSHILSFADDIALAPGVVVGRLQHDGVIPYKNYLNDLKIFYDWERAFEGFSPAEDGEKPVQCA